MEPQAASSPILDYAWRFKAVFAKEDFDTLLEYCCWNHAIKLIPGLESKLLKVYSLFSIEQKELDVFLEENLYTGWIWPSKSSIAAPSVLYQEEK